MIIIACMGPMIGFGGDVIIFLGIALAIEAFLASSIALLINQVFKIRMGTVLGVEAIALLVCGLFTAPLGWEWELATMLTWSGAFVCGCLFVLGWLFVLIRGEQVSGGEQDLCLLELTDRSPIEAAE
jgi:hypothetical protein